VYVAGCNINKCTLCGFFYQTRLPPPHGASDSNFVVALAGVAVAAKRVTARLLP